MYFTAHFSSDEEWANVISNYFLCDLYKSNCYFLAFHLNFALSGAGLLQLV